jgi:hypothetical protein
MIERISFKVQAGFDVPAEELGRTKVRSRKTFLFRVLNGNGLQGNGFTCKDFQMNNVIIPDRKNAVRTSPVFISILGSRISVMEPFFMLSR